MAGLKLAALDPEDLDVISAHVQDAVLKVGDVTWLPREGHLVLGMNRFAWEKALAGGDRERRRSALHFARVQAVKCNGGIKQQAKDTVLNLLAIRFRETEAPSGIIELLFAGGGTLRLEVECVEARLCDLGAAWSTERAPAHELGE